MKDAQSGSLKAVPWDKFKFLNKKQKVEMAQRYLHSEKDRLG
jgi:hypothetical protein